MSITSPATTAVPQQDAALEPAPSTWLPLTAGDTARGENAVQPEHAWPGRLFILIANLTAIGLGLGTLGATAAMVTGIMPVGLGVLMVGGMAVGSVIQRNLAKHVKHFTRWGWYGAMAELAFATLSKVSVLVGQPSAIFSVGFGITIDVLWMRYFWDRRADFDIDLDF